MKTARPPLRIPVALGIVTLAFGVGRATRSETLAPAPDEAARAVSTALQHVSAESAESVVLVSSYVERRGRLRKYQDGSGAIVRSDGVIVTNNHVVQNASRLEVALHDGRSFDAELVGRDRVTDLAVLRIDADDLRAMELRPTRPDVGELVLAMGNPLGLGHTVTLGVVNGLGRSDLDIAEYEDFIQTDAAINPGNSGGPLVDLRGRAVGINVAVGLERNGDGGLAFAIPSTMVRRVVEGILEDGRMRYAYLGVVTYRPWEASRALRSDERDGFDGESRVKVRSVRPNSPAEEAGIEAGDVLVTIGGRDIGDYQSFRNALIEASPDESTRIRVWRRGRHLQLEARLDERD